MNVVETYDLSKSFGKQVALDQVSLQIPAGAIFGVVGPAGCGKSTLLRLLATLTMPSAGDALIGGYSISGNPTRVRRLVGYMPAIFGIYPDMTVTEYLRFFAGCYGVPAAEHTSLVSDLLQLVDLSHRRNDPIERLTHGMRQRLSLARTLTHDPQVLLLDEPFTGADPRASVELRELLKELRQMGKTALVTTSTVADVAGLCTDLAILEQGKVMLSGDYPSLQERVRHHRTLSVKFFGNIELATRIVQNSPGTLAIHLISTGDSQMSEHTRAQATPATSENQPAPVVVTVLKQLDVLFDGSYEEASEILRLLMRSGVQVVSFSEQPDRAETLLVRLPTETGLETGAEMGQGDPVQE
jgi:ABC-2 type transport system ATP-binding protein